MKSKEIEATEIFADPTYDATFKMLFGKEATKFLTISFLNSMLGFNGTKEEIKDLTIVNSELIQGDVKAIESAIDVRCTTVGGQDIAIEMQRRSEDYFLSRTQDYMAKLISSQVQKDEGNKYHISMHKTYMLIISKAKLFLQDNKVEGDHSKMYEKTVVPMIKELGQEVPHNKMCWKFIELPKFKVFSKDKIINQDSLVKEQWLDFLIKCGTQEEIPDNISNIIKEGYKIMKIANWTKTDIENYELAKLKEAYQFEEEANIREKAEKLGFDKGIEQGILKGKWKGEVKGEIKQFKTFKEMEKTGMDVSKFYSKIKYNNEITKYFDTHPDCIDDTESVIMTGMDIEYPDQI